VTPDERQLATVSLEALLRIGVVVDLFAAALFAGSSRTTTVRRSEFPRHPRASGSSS
jgi:hypothetical protein